MNEEVKITGFITGTIEYDNGHIEIIKFKNKIICL